jgi:hypothetical protein
MIEIQIPANKAHRLLLVRIKPATMTVAVDDPFILDKYHSFASPPLILDEYHFEERYSTITLRSSSRACGIDRSILDSASERMSMSAKCSVPTRQVGQLIRAERKEEYISPPLSRSILRRPNHSRRSRLLTVKARQDGECVSGSVYELQDIPANAMSSLGKHFREERSEHFCA